MDDILIKEVQLTKLLKRILLPKYEDYIDNLSVNINTGANQIDSEITVSVYLDWRSDRDIGISDIIGGEITNDILKLVGYIIPKRIHLGVYVAEPNGEYYDMFHTKNYDPWDE